MSDLTVRDVFPISGGIMAAISQAGAYDFNPDMDLLLLSKCGKRCITPVVELILDGSDRLTDGHIERLAALIMTEYGDAWNRIRDALTLEYNPLSASIYHEEETTDVEGETGDETRETQQQDVSAGDTMPDNYISDGQNKVEAVTSGSNKQKTVRKIDRTHNGTNYKSADLLKSEIDMRITSRFSAQVIEDVKNYIAMQIY